MKNNTIAVSIMMIFFCSAVLSSCSKSVSKDDYDKIDVGMSKEQVVKILGEPQTKSESELMGMKTEMWRYQTNSLGGAKAITIFIRDGRVTDKNWTEI